MYNYTCLYIYIPPSNPALHPSNRIPYLLRQRLYLLHALEGHAHLPAEFSARAHPPARHGPEPVLFVFGGVVDILCECIYIYECMWMGGLVFTPPGTDVNLCVGGVVCLCGLFTAWWAGGGGSLCVCLKNSYSIFIYTSTPPSTHTPTPTPTHTSPSTAPAASGPTCGVARRPGACRGPPEWIVYRCIYRNVAYMYMFICTSTDTLLIKPARPHGHVKELEN